MEMKENNSDYMSRRIDVELIKWKNDKNRKPLLLRGARQVGKSSAVNKLSKEFEFYLEVNFELNKNINVLFENSLEPHEICTKLSAIFGIPVIPGKTLLFFDEIQACLPAISSLRFFFEKFQELHVIAAGSLLEFALREIPSYGVGRIRSMFMYPMSFNEFLFAKGEKLLIEAKRKATPEKPLDKPLHEKLIDQLKLFLIIGGLPEVVKKYIKTKDLLQCRQILNDLILTYTDDFAKYGKRVKSYNISTVFNSVSVSAGNKFTYKRVSEQMNIQQVKDALELLTKSGLIIPITYSSGNGIPLGSEANTKFRKYILFDTGLSQQLSGLNMSDLLLHHDFELINKGHLAEVFAGLELIKYDDCYQPHSLYYWQREDKIGNAEVDYLLQHQHKILPIEIKSGTKGSMQSIYFFMEKKKIKTGIRSSLENFSEFNHIQVIPLYALSNLF